MSKAPELIRIECDGKRVNVLPQNILYLSFGENRKHSIRYRVCFSDPYKVILRRDP